jgi:altronate dehydratase small subunit
MIARRASLLCVRYAPSQRLRTTSLLLQGKRMDTIVVMKSSDNVATCLKDLPADQVAEVKLDGQRQSVTLKNDIPFGHKIALVDIPQGGEVLKYAEVIGVASQPIAAGEHVHVHNVESIRARGDKI